ncbi:Uncharacterised protein [Escherichia coli]|uniref:Uncharacterized protein n=1 Tax=Escherichia coli TaxID=562 RepID=A0A376L918_ECOLX|nr:Uncharacterised protein [Escherichia coli]
MLSFFFALMVLPCTDGRVDKTAKEEDKADEQYDTGHATVKSVSFSHTGCLTHKRFLEVCPTLWTVLTLRHNRTKWSILRYVKKRPVDTYFNVMEVNLIIYNDDVIMMN